MLGPRPTLAEAGSSVLAGRSMLARRPLDPRCARPSALSLEDNPEEDVRELEALARVTDVDLAFANSGHPQGYGKGTEGPYAR